MRLWPLGAALAASGSYVCPFHAATGLYCPGCGMTRAVFASLGGNVQAAAHDNVLLMVSPLLVSSFLWNRRHRFISERAVIAISFLIATAFFLVRNLPHSFLTPS